MDLMEELAPSRKARRGRSRAGDRWAARGLALELVQALPIFALGGLHRAGATSAFFAAAASTTPSTCVPST